MTDHAWLRGVAAIPARVEPWMAETLADHAALTELLERWGSPVNLVDPRRLPDHAAELVDAAAGEGVEARVFFARKANKALAVVDAALAAGHGVDVASERELAQVLERLGADGDPTRIILSAGVKPRALLRLAVAAGVVVSVDNLDELDRLVDVAAEAEREVPVALRLAADLPGATPSRFGLGAEPWRAVLGEPGPWRRLRLAGLHFHLHGYAADHRTLALAQALDLLAAARRAGHRPEFVDIGGGVPMAYVDHPGPWETFWERHRRGLDVDDVDTLTWEGRALGHVYPLWQRPVRGAWLREVLTRSLADGRTCAQRLREDGVRLHLEPGRALLDGCGMTVARVEHRKQRADGTWLVGLAMNRTQCRSAADDFLLDPVLVPAPDGARTAPIEGYLVGAYCIEAELLTWRRMAFPRGVAVGDLVAWVNTAGYQMHILESASHQIPLAHNLVGGPGRWRPDDIDGWRPGPGAGQRAGGGPP